MFTGIVQTQAIVSDIVDQSEFRQLTVSLAEKWIENLEKGASVAVNGCCLTAVEFGLKSGRAFIRFDVIDETLDKTNLGLLEVGTQVNVERSLQMGTELGGHIVSGHVQSQGTLLERVDTESNCRMLIGLSEPWLEYVFSKGFIAVNGASLTVGEVEKQGFWLHLIPETLEVTNLGSLKAGDKVNIEVDQTTFTTVETVKRVMASGKFGLSAN
ncbi:MULTISPECIES: riboflavin synthase subunit alpha [Gammaproteobacteria]|uniref:riboflavin synthase subunit alpha n=1 Tax=Gammaproteobacteria TaxID=1236 RepID=UPI000DCF8666|nr:MULTISPECIES: riboflavin synthase subunit alpha [Gammaproteobacteria]RTE87336.1 riboflavin synthase subunit alpha [Aliidiomarina sp. B3213]TCZ92878.1 riboflavin synthase subunit alpha [Lysobacter sp. N42]